MHRRVLKRLVAAAGERKRGFLGPLVIGFGIWIGFPTVAAYQDMTSLVSGLEASSTRWNSYVEKSVAGSTHAAEMPFVDSDVTGSISGSGVHLAGVGNVSFRGKGGKVSATPDEDRVVRAEKKGRIVQMSPVAPPKNFNAGSIFERTSSLLRPSMDSGLKMAFAKPQIKGKEIQIAAAFHVREDKKPDPGMPAMLAALVNNDHPDVLATAYAQSEPDYAKASPFEALLQDEQPNEGRFIPPMAKGDHSWIQNPLPASVFSKKEQACLANGIYFEARSESVRGQAAVAQVILNRVRNPTYPNSICGVVYQNDSWFNRCQFSFACDGRKKRIDSPAAYKTAQEIAMAVTAGKIFIPEVGSSTHYYAQYVHPGWARTMQKMTKIGLHIFYRTYGGGWS
ncbi:MULTISPECIES: cell wall hydrolase [Mesorhizobium]|uniref:Cell wall hydrolase SleB n=1 Tax=Mesorhizobium ciceri biovar biserrulae (strain HAMBI 2942 / LMG 23838 / WSM1271) TaxID=765698 RepID=E8T935_MESCW|nr:MULTISPECIES: cell wall hydrolase [Mesorhizobium]ADV14193.1 cell wall hydrolase SleB [Mesorhizobium ciceri biovar biserrulae WSM1271]MBZ9718163.1 cell wall hydrolase [Mesorhizobium sp. AD1-1]MBZ9888458.1 cell wall hydrolase [Mesorhizobium sp. BR1-1-3]RUY98888.1 cell wall hydrolase [Mesorhizobium sp. M7A.F.Ca.CA.001.12.2.1]RUZ27726.1 cell wall hydrolase [Mesorhizobium sp. M7A.F.Ca.US.007.01.2.1]